MLSTSNVWVQSVDSTGDPHIGTTATKVSLSTDADVDDYCDAVKGKHSNTLNSFDASTLLVYRNRLSFEKRRDLHNLVLTRPIGKIFESVRSSSQLYSSK
jgi:hypothetical protein